MPTPPALTDEQRRVAYEKALKLRRYRARLKEWLGQSDEVLSPRKWRLSVALGDDDAQGMKVRQLLLALPGVAARRADRALEYAGIKPTNTVAQCGPRQIERLLEYVDRLPRT